MLRIFILVLTFFGSLSTVEAAINPNDAQGNNWMGFIPDSFRISEFSIPGTHDSAARYIADVFTPDSSAKTQNLTIKEQLNAGVRFLDIRCRHIGDSCALHHGRAYLSLNLNDVLSDVYTFLKENKTETVIMSVKEPEYEAENNTRSFEKTFKAYLDKNEAKGMWYIENSIPTLGKTGSEDSVRGKIVLLRRFSAELSGNAALGIDATNWSDNSTFCNTVSHLCVQDNYNQGSYLAGQKPDTYPEKYQKIEEQLTKASKGDSSILYLNFTSGVVFTWMPIGPDVPNIPLVSNYINPKVSSYFTNRVGHFGTLAMDFINEDIARKIYLSSLWGLASADHDMDGNTLDQELALGTDPFTAIRLKDAAYNTCLPVNMAMPVGDSASLKITADNDPIKFKAINLPSGLYLDQRTGEILGLPIRPGQFVSMLKAFDSEGKAVSTRWKFQIQAPLKLSYPKIITIKSHRKITILPKTAKRSWPTHTISSGTLPDGLHLDSETGAIFGHVTSDAQGSHIISVRATNSTGQLDTTFMLNVIGDHAQ
jgi:1-phosphatidylinositol phosphodiesterase